ncbi:ParE family toxin-like protein [Nitrospira sp. M1]
MKSVRSPAFRKLFENLPHDIQILAREKYLLWKSNPRHPSLHFKPVGKYWSVRITREYRAVCLRSGETCIWFWIGNHSEYDKLL